MRIARQKFAHTHQFLTKMIRSINLLERPGLRMLGQKALSSSTCYANTIMNKMRSLIRLSIPLVGTTCFLGGVNILLTAHSGTSGSQSFVSSLFHTHALNMPIQISQMNDRSLFTDTTKQEVNEENPSVKPSITPPPPPLGSTEVVFQIDGVLENGDRILPSDNSFYDEHAFEGRAGQPVIITLESNDFDTYLILVSPDQRLLNENDDISDQNSNSSLTTILPATGTYLAVANAFDSTGQGAYTLTVREIVSSSRRVKNNTTNTALGLTH